MPAHDDRACFAITAHHTTGFEDKICDKKEMEAFQPCHARAEKAKHRWAFSARDYFFAGNLRSWTIDDRDRCTYCIHFLRQSPNCVRYWKYENCPVCYDKDNYHRCVISLINCKHIAMEIFIFIGSPKSIVGKKRLTFNKRKFLINEVNLLYAGSEIIEFIRVADTSHNDLTTSPMYKSDFFVEVAKPK